MNVVASEKSQANDKLAKNYRTVLLCKIHWRVEEKYIAANFSLRQKRIAKYDGE